MEQSAAKRASPPENSVQKAASHQDMIPCPQCGHDLPNRCMARCRRCGYYEPCGSEPPLGWLTERDTD